MPEANNNIFDYLPDRLFTPLSGKHRREYARLILALYKAYFDETSDYLDDSFDVKIIRRFIEKHLIDNNLTTWVDEDVSEAVSNELSAINDRAYAIFTRLVDTGWLVQEKVGFNTAIFMAPKVTEFAEFLEGLNRDRSSVIGGSVYMIYSTLRSMLTDASPRDRVAGLEQVVTESRNVAKKMNRLASHLRSLSDKIEALSDLATKTNLFFDDFLGSERFSDYQDIKQKNHPFRYQSAIFDALNTIGGDSAIRLAFIEAIEQSGQTDGLSSDQYLDKSLRAIRQFFMNSQMLLDRVERNHLRLLRRVTESVKYQQRSSGDLQLTVKSAIDNIMNLPDDIDLKTVVHPIPEMQLISTHAFATLRTPRRKIDKSKGNAVKTVSDEHKEQTRLERQYAQFLRIEDAALMAWLEKHLQEKTALHSTDIIIDDARDFSAFTLARRLTIEGHSLGQKYRKTCAAFEFKLIEKSDIEQHDVVDCYRFTVRRK